MLYFVFIFHINALQMDFCACPPNRKLFYLLAIAMASSRVNIATMIELTFLVLAVYFSPTVSMKERVDHGTLLELSDLISNLEKRLSDSNFDSHLFDKLKSPSSESSDARSSKDESSLTSLGESHEDRREICMQKVTEGSIIRATDSLDAGAEFVDSFKSTESNLKCQDYCCKNTSCDVAVYQDKVIFYPSSTSVELVLRSNIRQE